MKKYYSVILFIVFIFVAAGIFLIPFEFNLKKANAPMKNSEIEAEKNVQKTNLSSKKKEGDEYALIADDKYIDDFELERIDEIFTDKNANFFRLIDNLNLRENPDQLSIAINYLNKIVDELDVIKKRIIERTNEITMKRDDSENLELLVEEYEDSIVLIQEKNKKISKMYQDKDVKGAQDILEIVKTDIKKTVEILSMISRELRKF